MADYLKPPPPQNVPGIILYHKNPLVDSRIRQVATLLLEGGYDLDTICSVVGRRPTQVKAYLRQIKMARQAYMEMHPEEFSADLQGLKAAILRRRDFDAFLRREYNQQAQNPSNRVGLLKLIMRNMRELEELTGVLILRVEHSGSVSVKSEMQSLLDRAPEPEREAYLDALANLIAVTESQAAGAPDSG